MLMIAPILFTFAIATHVAIHVLERAPHVQDSVTYLFQAQTLARGRLTAPAPPLAEAEATPHFAQEFLLVRHGRWFGKYTPGYPMLLALGVLVRAPWLVNPLLAALAVAVMFPLSKELMGDRRRQTADHVLTGDRRRQTADHELTDDGRQSTIDTQKTTHTQITDPLPTHLLLPLLLALSPFFLIMSGSLMAHTAELWWTLLFMLAWARTWRGAVGQGGKRGQRHWPVMSGSLMARTTERWWTSLFMLAWARTWRGAVGQGRKRGQRHWPVMSGNLMAHTAELWWTSLFMLAWARTWRGAAGQGEQHGQRHWPVMSGRLITHTAERWWTSPFMLAWARAWRGAAGHGEQRGQRHWPVMSGSLMAHTAELWWTTLFMFAWARAWRGAAGHGEQRGQRRWPILAGIAFGLLFLTRPFTAALIGLTYGLTLPFIYAFPLRPRPPAPLPSSSPLRPRSPAPLPSSSPLRPRSPAPLLFLATAAPFLLALFAYQAAVTGDPLTDPRLLYWPYDRIGFGPDSGEPQNAFTFAPTAAGPAIQWLTDPSQPPRGHSPARGLYNLGVNLDALENILFGWPALFSLSFVWLAFLLRRPTPTDWLLLLMVAAVGAGHVAYWASGVAYGPRYLFAALPALIILTARGLGALAAVVGRRPTVVILVALAAYSLMTLPGRVASYRDYNFVDPGVRAAVAESVEPPALVFITASATDWWEYGAFFSGNTPWLDGPVLYARDLGPDENARLAREFPGRAVYLWRDGQLQTGP